MVNAYNTTKQEIYFSEIIFSWHLKHIAILKPALKKDSEHRL